MNPVIEITPAAAAKIGEVRRADSVSPDKKLRVSIKGGGCSGYSYHLDFDTQKEGDTLMSGHGIELLVDSRSAIYLIGTRLDYSGGLNGKGFEFINPNATRTCGCGSSFAV